MSGNYCQALVFQKNPKIIKENMNFLYEFIMQLELMKLQKDNIYFLNVVDNLFCAEVKPGTPEGD